MHERTKAWDEEHGFKPRNGKKPPPDRPCDWCGKKAGGVYIHKNCADKERDFWLDILY